jgi:hypothetical protein
MANETFLDASGATKYRKSTGAGSAGDPAVAHNIIDGTVTVTGAGGTFPVTGTVTANIGTIAGLATQATLATATDLLVAIDASLDSITRAEDAIHSSGNRGVVSLAVRRDTLAGTASDGDYITLSTDADGRLYTTSTVTGSVAVTGTFWQTTQPVSLASVPSHDVTNAGTFAVQVSSALPTGANTIGNIGTIATSITPGTAAANLGKAEDAVHTTGDTGVMALAVQRNTAASGAADGDYATLNVNSTGRLYVDASVTVALPAGTNNIGDVDVLTVITGTGATNLGKAEDAAHASGDTGVAIWSVRRDTAASGAGTDGDYASLNTDSTGHLWTRVGQALPAGTNNIGDVDILSIATGTNLIGDVGGASRATGTGGLTGYVLNTSAATNNATSVKASAGRVYAVIATNNGAANRYLKLYNKASAPSPASDTPVATYMLPAGGGICRITDIGLVFSTGIAFAVVAGISATDNTSISANEVAVNIEYA